MSSRRTQPNRSPVHPPSGAQFPGLRSQFVSRPFVTLASTTSLAGEEPHVISQAEPGNIQKKQTRVVKSQPDLLEVLTRNAQLLQTQELDNARQATAQRYSDKAQNPHKAAPALSYTTAIAPRQKPASPNIVQAKCEVCAQEKEDPLQRSEEEREDRRMASPLFDNMSYGSLSEFRLQRFPGDGMVPPGDCNWAKYLGLRGSVETAKALVSMLGACAVGDSCLLLATKIAAITAEIAARVALDTSCFKGGDTGHRQQVQDKVNMINRCYRFFGASNCPPQLVAAMAVVVERAREVIALGAAVVTVALVVALIAAIIALAKVIAALAAAAVAGGAAVATAAAAIIALLVTIKDELSAESA